MTVAEIKDAVRAGNTVCAGSDIYQVKMWTSKKTGEEHWDIVCTTNGYTIGLTWQDGETLNALASDFYIKK